MDFFKFVPGQFINFVEYISSQGQYFEFCNGYNNYYYSFWNQRL